MTLKMEQVAGKNGGRVVLYALSTCVWCKKMRRLLDELGVGYDYVYVDLLSGPEKEKAVSVVKKKNPSCSYPTLVINDRECVLGFDEKRVKELLG